MRKIRHGIRLGGPLLLMGGIVCASNSGGDGALAMAQQAGSQRVSSSAPQGSGRASSSVVQSLLDKARAFEARGRMDMAKQTWQQVLLTDPNNTEALGGLARAAKLEGNTALANSYVERLRAINPSDPNIARAENMSAEQDRTAQLQQAGKLAESGQYAAAMAIYRQVFGTNPPPGDWALAYYETESATEEGRPHSIAGLTGLVQRYPGDPRYQIALGRILTYSPKTREEGRRYLERFAGDPKADEAIRQSLLWDSANPAMAARIRAYLPNHRDPQLAAALETANARAAESAAEASSPAARRPPSAAVLAQRQVSAAEIAAYKALDAQRIDDAEARFKAILARDPGNAKALAGMGYVRMQQGNFSGAISFLEQARQEGSTDRNLDAALDTSHFWFVMGEGKEALDKNDLTQAESRYRAALALRPASPEALAGLAGTLLKAGEPAAALPVFQSYLKLRPAATEGWRGLFLAEYQSGAVTLALATETQMPAAAHAELMKDAGFLQALAGAYSSAGRDRDAQRVLETAVAVALPEAGPGAKADAQLQYAATLFAANRLEQAAAVYRQVLAADHVNTAAWQGLVRSEHAMGRDAEALETVESMPPANYEAAMRDPGFETTVASVYQAEKKLDVAQDLLEKALAQQTTTGQKPSIAIEMQLAGIYMQRGNSQQAYPIYQRVLTERPARADAWAGLLAVLHQSGRDKETVAQVQLIPAATRAQLETDVGYLQTMAAVYGALGQSREAAMFLARVEQYYSAVHTAPPAEMEIQNAWLLYNGIDDAGLYRQLMTLGGRPDLTEEQRRTVQTIWTDWAVRRADQAAAAGNPQRALAILNAAERAFPDNPAVRKALANGYARAGQPNEAVQIYKEQNMASASAADYEAAIGAALAANDARDAESWLRFALAAYPSDPQVLTLAAKFEQSRGDTARAIEYYRRSLQAMPSAGSELATELSLPAPAPAGLPGPNRPQDLSDLLAPGYSDAPRQGYLPSYNNVSGQAMPMGPGNAAYYGAAGYPAPGNAAPANPAPSAVPPYMTNPGSVPGSSQVPGQVPQPGAGGRPTNLGPPQSRVDQAAARNLPSQAEVQMIVRRALSGELAAAETGAQAGGKDVVGPEVAGREIARPEEPPVAATASAASTPSSTTASTTTAEVYGPYVPYIAPYVAAPRESAYHGPAPTPVQVQLGDKTPHPAPPPSEMTDVVPVVRSLGNAMGNAMGNARGDVRGDARGSEVTSLHPDIAAAQAASIRRAQSDPSDPGPARTGSSLPVDVITTEDAQYVAVPRNGSQGAQNPAAQNPDAQDRKAQSQMAQNEGGPLVTQPRARPAGTVAGAGGVSDSGQQQYPRPRTPPASATTAARHAPARTVRRAPPAAATPPAAQTPAPVPAADVGPQLPVIESAPAQAQAAPGAAPAPGLYYPPAGPAYPQETPPSDAELMARNLPPLRGGRYNAQAPLPLTPRQDAEAQLASLEGSYSGWLGGTGIGRYRSGTPGLDRLYDIEAPVEASAMLGRAARITLVARPVFLNSGTLNPSSFAAYSANTVPYLGTLPANALNPPAQQLSNGVGGEVQLTAKDIGLAAGYTPYNFLVRNITGRFNWRPGGGPLTLFGDRDAVKDTQLSYAGLRDPGTISPTYAGNIWGGVVATTGGARLEFGSGGSGFYLSGEGGVLKGDHVLSNRKFEGAMGAYFRVKEWPGYGSLTVGGSLFGMHYAHNELGLTYGQGGYFSPDEYFLAAVPVTFDGYYRSNLHYRIAGALGVQTFQQDAAAFFPLDPGLQAGVQSALACTLPQIAAQSCGEMPVSGNTGFNYAIDSEVSYLYGEHWFLGGFLSGNNTNNYNTVSGGFFFRYTFRRQREADGHPTGLFPVDGFRPLRIL